MRDTVRHVAAVVLLALTLAGCSALTYTKSLFIAEVSLTSLADQFESVSRQMYSGCESRAIPVTTCAKYREFQVEFKRAYPLTVGMWEAAKAAGDADSEGAAQDIARVLSRKLSELAVEALGTFAPEAK